MKTFSPKVQARKDGKHERIKKLVKNLVVRYAHGWSINDQDRQPSMSNFEYLKEEVTEDILPDSEE